MAEHLANQNVLHTAACESLCSAPPLKPLFFGEPDRPLFGFYHPAVGNRRRGAGVVLCYPGPQEYNAAHRAFRKLALGLASEGFDVFRFDYFATGDSSGDTEAGDAHEWVRNIRTASRELRDIARVSDVSLVGMRLGALLASYACSENLAVRDLVLWDPVLDGPSYVRDLEATHARQSLQWVHSPRAPKSRDELLGFPFPVAQRESVTSLRLSAVRPQAARVYCIMPEKQQHESHDRLEDIWPDRVTPARVSYKREPGHEGALGTLDGILLADAAIAAILETLRS